MAGITNSVSSVAKVRPNITARAIDTKKMSPSSGIMPSAVVEAAIASCTKRFSVKGRNGVEIVLGDGTLHWHNLGGARDVYEPETGQCRPAQTTDVAQAARLLDALPNCTAVTPFFTPQDVPGVLMSLAMYRHTLPHTLKPIQGPGVQTAAEVSYIARMAEVAGPPGETLSLGISPISPLTFPDEITAAIIEKIVDVVRDGRITGIADIRDDTSSRTGRRLVIVLKRDAVPMVVHVIAE